MYQMSVKGTPCIILYCHRIGKGKDMLNTEEKYMRAAIKEAKKAYALEEVPIGCVIVRDGKIIARGYNRRNTDKNTLAHAELTAIKKASKTNLCRTPWFQSATKSILIR